MKVGDLVMATDLLVDEFGVNPKTQLPKGVVGRIVRITDDEDMPYDVWWEGCTVLLDGGVTGNNYARTHLKPITIKYYLDAID